MAKSQSQIVRQAEIFITNGAKPEAQAVIAGVGYSPATLTAGQTLVNAVKTGQAQSKELLARQKNATRAEKNAHKVAQKEMTSLSETARLLFANDPSTLTALGLQTNYVTVTNETTGEPLQQAAVASRGTAELISRWRQLVANAAALNTPQASELTAAGWDSLRLTAASALVEAYASADTAQQSAIQAYQQTSAQYQEDMNALKSWYGRASQLVGRAIKDADPTNQQNLRELLGLNG